MEQTIEQHAKEDQEQILFLTIVEEEADESMYWLELIMESSIMKEEQVKPLWNEAKELTAIFTSTGKSARNNKKE